MIKSLYCLARPADKLENNQYHIIVHKTSPHFYPPININSADHLIKIVKSDLDLPIGKVIYIYDAKLDTSTKEVTVFGFTLLDSNNIEQVSNQVEFSNELIESILNKEIYPNELHL